MDAPPRIVVHISREYGNLLAEGGVKDFTRRASVPPRQGRGSTPISSYRSPTMRPGWPV